MQDTRTRNAILVSLAARGWTGPTSYLVRPTAKDPVSLAGLDDCLARGEDGFAWLASQGRGKAGSATPALTTEEIIAASDLFRLMAS